MQLSAARTALPGSIVSSMTLAATRNMKADASFAWTFDIRISGTRYMTFRSVEKDLGRNRPQIRKGLGLIRARVPPLNCPSFNTQKGRSRMRQRPWLGRSRTGSLAGDHVAAQHVTLAV